MDDMLAAPVFPTNIGGNDENGGAPPVDGAKNDTVQSEGEKDPVKKTSEADQKPSAVDGEQKKDDSKENPPADTPKEPGVRKSKIDYILERKQKQLAKKNDLGDSEGGDDDNGLDGIAPEDAETIDKVVRQRYGDQFEQIERQQFQSEVNQFFDSDTLAKRMTPAEKEAFMEFATHPSRATVPFKTIAYEVMGETRLLQIGAEIEREASKKATESRIGASVGGHSGEAAPVDFDKMTDAEFEAYQFKVRTSGR